MTADLASVRATVQRLFIACDAGLRKEDEQKSRELAALLPRLAKVRRGAHVVDAAAGKASVGLVAAELLPFAQVTVIERDPARIRACREAAGRMRRDVMVAVREADVRDAWAWPDAPDFVVALHACGPATDAVIEGAVRAAARHVLVVPCCYGAAVPSWARLARRVQRTVPDALLARRVTASLVDLERKLRLEAAGYETRIEELVAPTVTPHNLVLAARRIGEGPRAARARSVLEAHEAVSLDE